MSAPNQEPVRTIEFKVRVLVEPDGDGFHTWCPALRGLHAPGATEAEALGNAKDAALAYIESLIRHGDPIPVGIRTPRPGWVARCFAPDRAGEHVADVVVPAMA